MTTGDDNGGAQRVVYLRLYSTTVLNLIADSVSSIALPLAFLVATGSIELAASLAAATKLPQMLLIIPLGAVADRLPRRSTIITAYAVEFVVLLLLIIMLLTGSATFWPIVFLGALRGTVSALGEASYSGYVVMALGRQNLLKYNSRVETIEGVAAIGGPSLAGWLVSTVGGALSLLYSCVSSLVNGVIYFFLPDVDKGRPKPAEKVTAAQILRDVGDGIRLVITDPRQLAMSAVSFSLGAVTSAYALGVVYRLSAELKLEPWLIGLVMAATGAGGIVVSLVMARWADIKHTLPALVTALLLIGIMLVLIAWFEQPLLQALSLFILDAALVTIFIYSGTFRGFITPDRYLSRIDTVDSVVFSLGAMLAYVLAGVVLGSFSSALFLPLMAATLLLALAAVFRAAKGIANPVEAEQNS